MFIVSAARLKNMIRHTSLDISMKRLSKIISLKLLKVKRKKNLTMVISMRVKKMTVEPSWNAANLATGMT